MNKLVVQNLSGEANDHSASQIPIFLCGTQKVITVFTEPVTGQLSFIFKYFFPLLENMARTFCY